MKRWSIPFAVAVAVGSTFLVSCQKDGHLFKQKKLEKVNTYLENRFLTARLLEDYESATIHRSEPDQRRIRNEFQSALMAIVDYDYHQYEVNLSGTTRGANTAFDITVLGLTGAATITGGEQAKTVLAGIAALLTGARIAIDKNVFYESALPILVNRMRVNRAELRITLLERRKLSADEYTLYDAIGDVYMFYQAGTVTSAITDIANENARKAEAAATRTSALLNPTAQPSATSQPVKPN